MFALLIAVLMILAGVLLIGFLLLLRNKADEFAGPPTNEMIPGYGDCYDLCRGDSGEVAENCVGLCAYGWP
jgi:hypothetical protein